MMASPLVSESSFLLNTLVVAVVDANAVAAGVAAVPGTPFLYAIAVVPLRTPQNTECSPDATDGPVAIVVEPACTAKLMVVPPEM